jgi:ABC-2 type transport system ATP-binding protein
MTAPAIVATRLTRQFGDFVAVDAISFEVAPGEIFGFLGANGAGKTTAIRMLTGLLAPSSGTAAVAGFEVAAESESVRRNIGYMSQRFSLYDDLTVRENVELYGGIYGMKRGEVAIRLAELLASSDLAASGEQLVGTLPLGWKQQVALSVAMVHRPRVLFLDEPTSGVDPITRRKFWELIYQAAAAGTTVLVTTHYLDEAEYCDRISIMVAGGIAAIGTPDEVRRQFDAADLDEVFLRLTRSGAG